ncbi:MAG: ATP-binding cassette domain-containing protein, partial [Rhodospirillaceae bacterium]|nr:ATP-binding cassette domain-containing protein [Rhodospirillaceae bacterium]
MAPSPPLLSLRGARIGFGGRPLFADVGLSLGRGERACLVGRNGSGKSTLLKALAGAVELDAGERFVQPGTRIALLAQQPRPPRGATVAAVVAVGLPPDAGPGDHRVRAVLDRLGLDGDRIADTLSGGEARRMDLAQALVGEPDLLLLDEPTNHLDLPTIEALEEMLAGFSGGLLVVSHDRAFLRRLSTRTLWLDRGRLRVLDKGYDAFEAWSEAVLAAEAEEARRLERRIEQETWWLGHGITARRRRNEGRLRRLLALRRARAERLEPAGRARLAAAPAEAGGQLVIEAEAVSYAYPGAVRPVVTGFSTRILRGDRIGIVGPNGAGKTTLLRLLTGALAPTTGRVRHGANLQPVVLDQGRAALDETATLWRTLAPGGGDSLMVRGTQRHVVAYLRDFLFDEKQALMPVSRLSGGERARLLLARLFAAPGNLVVLDEPTNDLDVETLDLLQEVIADYDGTVLMVSHDRDFLDRTVTAILALEGDGRVVEYTGGYSDYRRQRGEGAPPRPRERREARAQAEKEEAARRSRHARPRLSYNELRELEALPGRIEALTREIAALEARLSDGELYARDRAAFAAATARHAAARRELDAG